MHRHRHIASHNTATGEKKLTGLVHAANSPEWDGACVVLTFENTRPLLCVWWESMCGCAYPTDIAHNLFVLSCGADSVGS